jgi:hypothetical protein
MFPFRITCQLSLSTFIRLSLIIRYTEWHMILFSIVALLLVITGMSDFDSHPWSFNLVIGFIGLFILPVLSILRGLIIFRRFPYMRQPVYYEFADNYVQMNREGVEVRIQWPKFQTIKMAGGYLLLKLSKAEAVIVPIDQFSADQLEAVQNKIKHPAK